MRTHAVILAAGSGSRMVGFDIPKALILLRDKPLFLYSLETFINHEEIESVVLVVHPEYKEDFIKYTKNIKKPLIVLEGGSSRLESSSIAIDYLSDKYPSDNVLIHDAARPFIKKETISLLINEVKTKEAVMLTIPSKDTIAIKKNNVIDNIPSRVNMLIEQTPCAFKIDLIKKAYSKCKDLSYTDDCQLIMNINHPLYYVMGDEITFKVTYPFDLKIAELYLEECSK